MVELLAQRLLYTFIMLNRLRFVLVCLLALALPVQGFAAATMLFCVGGSHHRGTAQVGNPLIMGGDHDVGTSHEHPAGTPAHAHVGNHSSDAASPHDDSAQTSASSEAGQTLQLASTVGSKSNGKSVVKVDGKCSACSACCASVALPSALMVFQPVKADSPLVAIVTSAALGFLTDGQDRPPRTFLA